MTSPLTHDRATTARFNDNILKKIYINNAIVTNEKMTASVNIII